MAKPIPPYTRPPELMQALVTANWPVAETILRDLVKRQKLNPEMLLDLGRTLNAQGKWEDALLTLKRGARRWPEDPGIANELGTAAINLRQWDIANKQFTALYGRMPEDPSVKLNLATCRLEAGDIEGAIPLLEQVRVDPSFEDKQQMYAGLLLVEAYRDAKRIDDMRREVARLTSLYPATRSGAINLLTKGSAGRVPLVAAELQAGG